MHDHGYHHHHHHHHGHGHSHAPADYGRAFIIGIGLNIIFVLAEIIYGLQAQSVALLADAGHNASDVLSLILAYIASRLLKRKPSQRFTYGLQSTSILAALANAVVLMVAVGGIMWEAVYRFSSPQPVEGMTIMIIASLGVLINGGTALMFMGNKHDLNVRGAYLHMAADAGISLGVVISGLVIMMTGWLWLDPAVSIVISLVIVAGTWGLLKDSLTLALHAVPAHIDPDKVRETLNALPGVASVHDLHIWAMSTTENALSAHLLMKNGHPGDAFLAQATTVLQDRFHIGHSTLQLELGDTATDCPLAPDTVI
jgi:cobalt-zinc-cadmium efflux system protein